MANGIWMLTQPSDSISVDLRWWCRRYKRKKKGGTTWAGPRGGRVAGAGDSQNKGERREELNQKNQDVLENKNKNKVGRMKNVSTCLSWLLPPDLVSKIVGVKTSTFQPCFIRRTRSPRKKLIKHIWNTYCEPPCLWRSILLYFHIIFTLYVLLFGLRAGLPILYSSYWSCSSLFCGRHCFSSLILLSL